MLDVYKGLSRKYIKSVKKLDAEPNAVKADYVGRRDVAHFDIKMGLRRELYLVNKNGSVAVPTGVFPDEF